MNWPRRSTNFVGHQANCRLTTSRLGRRTELGRSAYPEGNPMAILITIREEADGQVSVDYVKSGSELVVLVDFREVSIARMPNDLMPLVRSVRRLPKTVPWRDDILTELTSRQRELWTYLSSGAPDDQPHAG